MFNNNFGNVFAGSASTEDTTVTSYSASTQRDIVDEIIASYSASTERNLHAITTYSVLTQRDIGLSASYTGSSQREVLSLTEYSSDTERTINELSTYSALTSRVVGADAFYSADTERDVTGDPNVFWTNFNEYETGVVPYDWSDFTSLSGADLVINEHSTIDDPQNNKYKLLRSTETELTEPERSYKYYKWDKYKNSNAVNRENVEILVKTSGDGDTRAQFLVRGTPEGTDFVDTKFYTVNIFKRYTFSTEKRFFIGYRWGSTNSALSGANATYPASYFDTDVYIRFRAENINDTYDGHVRLRAKLWHVDEPEPSEWTFDITDHRFTGEDFDPTALNVGMSSRVNQRAYIFSVASDGQVAPLIPSLTTGKRVDFISDSKRTIQKLSTYNVLSQRTVESKTIVNNDTYRRVLTGELATYFASTVRDVRENQFDNKYWTDFSEYETGVVPYDWIIEDSGSDLHVEEDVNAVGGKLLSNVDNSSSYYLNWDRIDDYSWSQEALALFRRDESQMRSTIRLRAQTYNDHPAYYQGYVTTDSSLNRLVITRVAFDGAYTLGFVNLGEEEKVEIGDRFWVRFRFELSDHTLMIKQWKYDEEEPEEWRFVETDDDDPSTYLPNVGRIGLGTNINSNIDVFSVAIGGETATKIDPNDLLGDVSHSFWTHRGVIGEFQYNALTSRALANVITNSKDTSRRISSPTEYISTTDRVVTELIGYNGYTQRWLSGDVEHIASTNRILLESVGYDVSTNRRITELSDHIGSTERTISVLDQYLGSAVREIQKIDAYNGFSQRKTSLPTDYIGSTERIASEITNYNVLTERTVYNTALYEADTLRDVEDPYEGITFYYTDFSEYTTGTALTDADWTGRFDRGTNGIIEDDPNSIGGKRLRATGSQYSTEWRGLSWDAVDGDPNTDDIEVLMLYTPNGYNANAFVRGDDPTSFGSTLKTFFGLSVNDDELRGWRFYRDNAIVTTETIPSIDPNAKYWARVRAEGDIYKGKIWKEFTQEPDEWMLVYENSSLDEGFVGIVQRGSTDALIDVFAVATGGGTARGYESGITGEISRSSTTSRTIKAPSTYEALTVRRATEFESYISSTKRTVSELDEYIAQTNRTIHELTDYNAYTQRDITLMFAVEYLTDTERRVTLPIETKSFSERILTSSTDYVGSTSRQINVSYVLNHDTRRELHRSTDYKATTLRELQASTTFYADAERELHALTERFSATERRSTLPTDYISSTDREIHRGVFYVGRTKRQVFQEGNFTIKSRTERIILVGSSYTDIYNDRYRTYNLESVPMRVYALSAISREFRVEAPNRQKDIEFESRTLNVKYK